MAANPLSEDGRGTLRDRTHPKKKITITEKKMLPKTFSRCKISILILFYEKYKKNILFP